MQSKIPLLDLQLQHEAIRLETEVAVRRVFERQDFILGAEVGELEQAVARGHDCAYGIGCASGSDAILLSLLALGIGPGDEVLVPAFTFFSTASAVVRAGARPVFVDVDPRTFNLHPEAVEAALRGPHAQGMPQAVIPVHLFGQCAEMEPLLQLAGRHGLRVVEDAAQAIAARSRGRAAGSMGIVGCFSFYPTKNLGGAGDGGMVTTSDAALAERLRSLRNHGTSSSADSTGSPRAGRHRHAHLGINSRLDTLQAAILLVKLQHLDAWTALRQTRAAIYRTAFLEAGLADPGAVYPTCGPTRDAPVVLPYSSPQAEHVYHQFTVRVERRDELASYLAEQGIETGIYYPVPLHLQPAFASLGGRVGDCPESERAAQEVLSIPLYPEITEELQVRVVQTIQKFYREPGRSER
ncbi:MAG: DegT/DnrJ/EryC1/StrS family aminotransferase [Terriglobia bacterium]